MRHTEQAPTELIPFDNGRTPPWSFAFVKPTCHGNPHMTPTPPVPARDATEIILLLEPIGAGIVGFARVRVE